MFSLAAAFLVTAFVYASAGFGGGSTYNALLAIAQVDYRLLPSLALACNVIVVAGNSLRSARAGLLDRNLIVPFASLSVPLALIGGRIPVDRESFMMLLGMVLLATGLVVGLSRHPARPGIGVDSRKLWMVGLPVGGILGLIAGMVGIGGGIFLAPLLYLAGAADPRRIAAAASVFILINSAAGLVGQTLKQGGQVQLDAMAEHLPLFVAVLAGGQLGSHLGLRVLTPGVLRLLTATLVIYAAVRLIYTSIGAHSV